MRAPCRSLLCLYTCGCEPTTGSLGVTQRYAENNVDTSTSWIILAYADVALRSYFVVCTYKCSIIVHGVLTSCLRNRWLTGWYRVHMHSTQYESTSKLHASKLAVTDSTVAAEPPSSGLAPAALPTDLRSASSVLVSDMHADARAHAQRRKVPNV